MNPEKKVDYFGVFENLTAPGGPSYYVKAVYTDGKSDKMQTDWDVHTKEKAMRHAQAYTNALGCNDGKPKDMTGGGEM